MAPTRAALQLEEQLDKTPKRAKKRPNGRDALTRAEIDMVRLRKAAHWDKAKGMHFVALFAWLHREIYKVESIDLYKDGAAFAAASAAEKLLRDEFKGIGDDLVKFIAWCWARERKRMERGTESSWRLNWRGQFVSRTLLVDYRVACAGGQR